MIESEIHSSYCEIGGCRYNMMYEFLHEGIMLEDEIFHKRKKQLSQPFKTMQLLFVYFVRERSQKGKCKLP